MLDENQESCVVLLTQALELAKRGEIETCGVVMCRTGGFASEMAGTKAGDLYLGCADLQDKILTRVIGGDIKKPKKSSILRLG